MLATLISTLYFLLLHVVVRRRLPEAAFDIALALSRGLAAATLTVAGFLTLWWWWPLWPVAFLERAELSSPAYWPVFLALGHLIADFLWMGWGMLEERGRRDGWTPRTDLVVHHLLGLVACGLVLGLGIGGVAIGVVLTTEMMPVTSGLIARARLAGDRDRQRRLQRLRLAALLGWRLPLWGFMTVRIVALRLAAVREPAADPQGLAGFYLVALAALAVIVVLDLYWCFTCWQALRRVR